MIPYNISSYQTHFAIKDYIDFLILVPLIWNTEITGVYFLMMLYIFFKYQDMFQIFYKNIQMEYQQDISIN